MTIINQNLIIALFVTLIIILLFVIFSRYLERYKYNSLVEWKDEIYNEKKYKIFFLIFSLLIPLTEIPIRLFKIREENYLFINLIYGTISFVCFLSIKYFKQIKKNASQIFYTLYFSYNIISFYEFITHSKNLLFISEFLMLTTVSSIIFNKTKKYYIYFICIFLFLIGAQIKKYITLKEMLIYINFLIILAAVSYGKYIIDYNLNLNLYTSFYALNKGNSVIFGLNKEGIIQYQSNNTKKIFGENRSYIGKNIKEIIALDFEEIEEKIRKEDEIISEYSNPNSKNIFIQWHINSQRKDMLLLVGTDVSKIYALKNNLEISKNRLETLLANSGELVFVLDKELYFKSYFNKLDDKFNQTPNLFLGKHITKLRLPKQTLNEVIEIIEKSKEGIEEDNYLEYSIEFNKKKSWYLLKISIIRNKENEVEEILCIARNKTAQKEEEQKKEIHTQKTEIYNKILIELSSTPLETFDTFEKAIQNVTKHTAEALNCSRVSIWNYYKSHLECLDLFENDIKEHSQGLKFKEDNYLNYINNLKSGKVLRASNVFEDKETAEILHDYCVPFDIKSKMGVPIILGGELKGVVCCEQTNEYKNWTDEDESFLRMIADILSIFTEQHLRKRAEKKLLQTRRLLEEAYTLVKLGVWEYFPQTKKTYWSNTLKEILEVEESYSPKFLATQEYYKDIETYKKVAKFVNEQIEKKQRFDIQYQIKTAKGNIRWVREFGQPEYVDGKCVRIYGALQNIDDQEKAKYELQQSQQKFQYISETIQDVFWLFDITKNETEYISPSCIHVLGKTPEEFYERYDVWKEYVYKEDRHIVDDAHKEIIEKDYFEIEYRIIYNNEIKWIFEKSYAIKNEQGKTIKNSGMCIDITKQKLTEQKLQKVKEIEETNKTKSAFLANMSHEIRTPLNGVIGLTDILSQTALSQTQTKYVSTIQSSATLLLEIINNILDYSKIEVNKLSLVEEPCNIKELCYDIAKIISFHCEQKKLQFVIDFDQKIPPNIIIDAIRLKQILINLLGNAVKFTEKGTIQFQIKKIKTTNTNKIKLHFSIRDTGIGIQDENLYNIFEAFTQEDITTTKKYGGTGLGLTISSKLLEMMKSKLRVESSTNNGSDFYFDLFVEESKSIFPIQKQIKELQKTNQEKYKILLAEDNEVNMFLARVILNSLLPNAIIIEALNGEEAINLFESENPDLIFMDIQMPIVNGYNATKKIRQFEKIINQNQIPIIALTAGTANDEYTKCIEVGMNDLLIKPIVKNTIEKALTKHLKIVFENELPHNNIENNGEENKHIDLKALEKSMDENPKYMKSILPYIKESLQDGLYDLKTFFADKDLSSICIVAHRIKGTALTASMPTLFNQTKNLEFTEIFNEKNIAKQINEIEVEIENILILIHKKNLQF